MTINLSPAEYVISVFGGVRPVARAIGRDPSTITKWKRPKEKKGCGGRVPSVAQSLILNIAKKKKLDITPDDLLYGRRVSKNKSK